jgi:type I restriction enzyme S subunit
MARLGEVAEHCLGKMLDVKKNRGRNLPYLRNPNVRWFDIDLSDLREMPFEDHELTRYGLQYGDVLICEGGDAGRAAIWNSERTDVKFQKAIHRVRPGRELNNRFLVHRLMADHNSGLLADYFTGATIKHLTGQDLARYEFPLPPLADQHRIVDLLDRAGALRSKRREALGLLDDFGRSAFLEHFGDPKSNPHGWALVAFGDVCETRLGKMLDQKQRTGQHLRPYLRNANVQWFRFDLRDVYEMDFDQEDRESFRLEEGDLLICEGGEPGRCSVWRGEIPECYYQKALHRARPRSGRAEAHYLAWLLRLLAERGSLADHVTSATIAHLTGEKLKAMKIPLPPIALQREFCRRLGAADTLRRAHQASLDQLDSLFASLQARALRGGI